MSPGLCSGWLSPGESSLVQWDWTGLFSSLQEYVKWLMAPVSASTKYWSPNLVHVELFGGLLKRQGPTWRDFVWGKGMQPAIWIIRLPNAILLWASLCHPSRNMSQSNDVGLCLHFRRCLACHEPDMTFCLSGTGISNTSVFFPDRTSNCCHLQHQFTAWIHW